MADYFFRRNRNFGLFEIEPDFINDFKPESLGVKTDFKAKLRGLKRYGYDTKNEEK